MQNELVTVLVYIVTAPFFWPAMGMTTATAMIVGGSLYDGQLKQVSKAIVMILSYAALLIFTISARINAVVDGEGITPEHFPMVYGGVATVCIITFFWLLGLFGGVLILHLKNYNKK